MSKLNEQQARAAAAPLGRPLKIIAGAGTGKTETLARRFVNLVQAGLSPQRILMLTFTEKAAAEMRGRVTARLLEAQPDLPLHELLHPWTHTFHGFCARVLADHTFWLRLSSPLLVLEEWQQRERWMLIWEQFRESLSLRPDWQPYNAAAQRAFDWHKSDLFSWIMSLVDQLRGQGHDSRALLSLRPPADYEEHCREAYQQLRPLAGHCFDAYRATLQDEGALDFAELVLATVRLLERRPAVAERLRQRFGAILVDEFQDTDRAQLELLELLDPGFQRTTVVGDPRQALYGWRQARVENIIAFPEAPTPALTVSLRTNYRSQLPICELANRAIAGYHFSADRPEFDLSEGLIASKDRPAGRCIELRLTATVVEEAAYVAATARQLHDSGQRYGEMALLVRSRTHLRLFEDALLTSGIPYEVMGGPGFYEQQEVRNTLALLRLLAAPGDILALLRVLESDIVGLPDGILAAVRRPVQEGRRRRPPVVLPAVDDPQWLPQWAELLPRDWPGYEQALAALGRFAALYADVQRMAFVTPPAQLLQLFWERSGLRARLLAAGTPGAMRRLLSLDRLLHLAENYSLREPLSSLAGLSAHLKRLAAGDDEPLPSLGAGHDALQILTVHAAKGREFDTVFLADTRIPRATSKNIARVLFDEDHGLIIKTDRDAKHETINQLYSEVRRRAMNEERCIWYVALTRARERLYVLHDVNHCALDEQAGRLVFVEEGKIGHKHFFHELWNQLQFDEAGWCAAVSLVDGRAPVVSGAARHGQQQAEAPAPGGAQQVAPPAGGRERLAVARRMAARLAQLRAQAVQAGTIAEEEVR